MAVFGEDIFSMAWREAQASCPAVEILYDTFEFRHSSLSPPLRIVSNITEIENDGLTFTLEDDAPVNPGQEREFLCCPFEAQIKAISHDEMPQISFKVDNIGREISPYITEAVQTRESIYMRYRGYSIEAPDEVGFGPLEFILNSCKTTGSSFSGIATLLPIQKSVFPTKTYDRVQFPALIRQLT